jgi:hypothetical protein
MWLSEQLGYRAVSHQLFADEGYFGPQEIAAELETPSAEFGQSAAWGRFGSNQKSTVPAYTVGNCITID